MSTIQRKIYVASSWRNQAQPEVVNALRGAGHEVYDFRNPAPGRKGFAWSDIDPAWQTWCPGQFRQALNHPIAQDGFKSDWDAMVWADTGVLVMPCGRSAHIEAGYFTGSGKTLIILLAEGEPELMYRMATKLCVTLQEVLEALATENTCAICGRPVRKLGEIWHHVEGSFRHPANPKT